MGDELNSLYRLTETHIKPAAEVLARAFQEYPLSAFFIPDASKRIKKQSVSFRAMVRRGIKYGEVYASSPELEGVAVWFPSDAGHETLWSRILSGQFFVPLAAGRAVLKRQRAFGEYAGVVRQRVAPFRHLYLQLLGVEPAFQGKGYSSALIKPMLARADREGLPCFLETQAEKNVALYEHFGFRVAEEGIIPGSDVRSWAMVRK